MSSKLTVTYGIRWEDYLPESVNAKGNGGFANLDQGRHPGERFRPVSDQTATSENYVGAFGPRIGIAYQLRPKTVVRIGYGRSFRHRSIRLELWAMAVTQNLPVLVHQSIQAHEPQCNSHQRQTFPYIRWTLPQGHCPPPFPQLSVLTARFHCADRQTAWIREFVRRCNAPAAIDMWNATVEHQLTSTMTVEVSYVGNKGTHGFRGVTDRHITPMRKASPGMGL